jgi:hypothetical protein
MPVALARKLRRTRDQRGVYHVTASSESAAQGGEMSGVRDSLGGKAREPVARCGAGFQPASRQRWGLRETAGKMPAPQSARRFCHAPKCPGSVFGSATHPIRRGSHFPTCEPAGRAAAGGMDARFRSNGSSTARLLRRARREGPEAPLMEPEVRMNSAAPAAGSRAQRGWPISPRTATKICGRPGRATTRGVCVVCEIDGNRRTVFRTPRQ